MVLNKCTQLTFLVRTKIEDNNSHVYHRQFIPFVRLTKCFDKKQILMMLKKKYIVLIPCGKCQYCLNIRKNYLSHRIKTAINNNAHNYLLTITFSNKEIKKHLAFPPTELNNDKHNSLISTLSKKQINNIIKNLKNKINKYYKEKVNLNYFLCGEYGPSTKRAHYHIILMMNKPLPYLKPNYNLNGQFFTSKIFNSSQFGFYSIELIISSKNVSNYLTKYLTKSNVNNNDSVNYTRFNEQWIDWIAPYYNLSSIPKNEKVVLRLLFNLQSKNWFYKINFSHKDWIPYRFQKEFIKYSRGLGISNNLYEDFKNGTLNKYYFDKHKYMINNLYYSFSKHIALSIKKQQFWNQSKLRYDSYYTNDTYLFIGKIIALFLSLQEILDFINNTRHNRLVSFFLKNMRVSNIEIFTKPQKLF